MLATKYDIAAVQNLTRRLRDARLRSDELFNSVKTDSLYERPIPERHRIVFYIGHLEAFDWNLLARTLNLKDFHPAFDRLFAFGIDPVGGGLPDDPPSAWPSLNQVREYASKIRQLIDESLAGLAWDGASSEYDLTTLLNVAIEHRLMHAETLAYMLHQLPLAQKLPPPTFDTPITRPQTTPKMIDIPAGTATLGQKRSDEGFGWDNEFETLVVTLPAFSVDQYKVTNRQYLDFILAGGYDTPKFWNEDDWSWKTKQGIQHPAFWRRDGDRWFYRAMFAEAPLPMESPVYVSHAEARAYASWVGKVLPTEAEWHRAAYGAPNGRERMYPWGEEEPNHRFGNFDFARWESTPVHAFPEGNSAFGVGDLVGNGWEWTSTPFAPLPGFEPFPFYRGYSADFFDGKHFVIKGGSSRTAASMLRRPFRNWFQSHYQYTYTGFRCVSH
jgi:iron(II)-dependent oxidoreductase